MIDIEFKNAYSLKIPHSSDKEEVNKMKEIIGNSTVDAYSIDPLTYKVVKGRGKIENNGLWNYHNNYDASSDEMYFDNKTRWFTLNEDRAKEIFNKNAVEIRELLERKLEEYKNL